MYVTPKENISRVAHAYTCFCKHIITLVVYPLALTVGPGTLHCRDSPLCKHSVHESKCKLEAYQSYTIKLPRVIKIVKHLEIHTRFQACTTYLSQTCLPQKRKFDYQAVVFTYRIAPHKLCMWLGKTFKLTTMPVPDQQVSQTASSSLPFDHLELGCLHGQLCLTQEMNMSYGDDEILP